jgi:hypothetical protein
MIRCSELLSKFDMVGSKRRAASEFEISEMPSSLYRQISVLRGLGKVPRRNGLIHLVKFDHRASSSGVG